MMVEWGRKACDRKVKVFEAAEYGSPVKYKHNRGRRCGRDSQRIAGSEKKTRTFGLEYNLNVCNKYYGLLEEESESKKRGKDNINATSYLVKIPPIILKKVRQHSRFFNVIRNTCNKIAGISNKTYPQTKHK